MSPGPVNTAVGPSELQTCEAMMLKSLQRFVAVGLAFASIRDLRLYRAECSTFEAYCRQKWHRGGRWVNQLIAAAQMFTHLTASCPQHKPDCEAQLRPLIGLTPEQAQLAWEYAATKAGAERITERHVKSAVEELQLAVRATRLARNTGTPKAKRVPALVAD
jgi:hypothetical protein